MTPEHVVIAGRCAGRLVAQRGQTFHVRWASGGAGGKNLTRRGTGLGRATHNGEVVGSFLETVGSRNAMTGAKIVVGNEGVVDTEAFQAQPGPSSHSILLIP